MSKEKILQQVKKKLAIKCVKGFDPGEYFKTRDGLYVWSDFKERILSKAEPIKIAKNLNLSSYDLVTYASDEKIEEALPKKHIFKESEVCAVISALIEKQSKGEEGAMLNNGYANLFYTPSFVVIVCWVGSGWVVSAWVRGGGDWDRGGRVFSPATDTLKS